MAGHGRDLALTLRPTANVVVPPAPAQPAAIGALPDIFPNLDTCNHVEILDLIIFYNQDFGIQVGDTVRQRAERIKCFISEL